MLHTLNKAWVKCLARHTNKRIMFVYSTSEELNLLIEIFDEVHKEIGDICLMWVLSKDTVEEMINNNEEFEMQDDILISHNLHYNIKLNHYLGSHCKRKCC